MTKDTNVVLEAIRRLSSGKNLPTSVAPKVIRDDTGLSENQVNTALYELINNGYRIVLTEGSNTVTNVSLSIGFE
ncbi:hypothetical protein LCIT_03170 [Leuconostoc citreum]|uniref:Uncharacterized protein n=1 Tax=Leuconostoc citreum TaxID=33964 RepID=A0A5A5TZL1_LEUCI|nr:hypothetical protein [Leuconostoc citreum]GDZ83075.1 hypothetical protein LCIT_03170 [Leuconostoc citreum]